MKSVKKALLYGFLLWFLPFITSFIVYPIQDDYPVVFKAIMGVVLLVYTIVFAFLYFKDHGGIKLFEGILVSTLWLLISIVLDMIIFVLGPLGYGFWQYLFEIGISYFTIPAVIIFTSYMNKVDSPKGLA